MLFALIDYLNYRHKRGRYARDFRMSIMGGAFEGSLPETALQLLRPGDILLIQTLGWPISWLIMYLTKSEISHVAFYVGDKRISHATLGGVTIDPIETLFSPDTRILPCTWPMADEKRSEIVALLKDEFLGRPYGWSAVFLKGFRIVTGRDWPYFQWKVFADFSIALALLDLPCWLILHQPVLSWLIPGYLATVIFNALLWRIHPLRLTEWTGKPCDALHIIQKAGGSVMFDAYSMHQQSLAGKGASNGDKYP